MSIGTGGSVGREGPIVQIGSSMGSAIGQWLGVGRETLKVLVACGAAAGIAATFNALHTVVMLKFVSEACVFTGDFGLNFPSCHTLRCVVVYDMR